MPVPPGLVVKNGTQRLSVRASPGPSSSISAVSSPLSLRQRTMHGAATPRRFHRVAHEVDQHLLDLIGVDRQVNGWSGLEVDPVAVQRRDAAHERAELCVAPRGRRQPREPRVCAHEALERFRAVVDDREPVLQCRRASRPATGCAA